MYNTITILHYDIYIYMRTFCGNLSKHQRANICDARSNDHNTFVYYGSRRRFSTVR